MSEPAPTREHVARHWLDDPPTVGAVLVTHNGAAWLPKVLESFATMYHAPDAWRAVDVHSIDGSARLITASFGGDRVIRAPRRTGFGAAVQKAVDAMPRTDWIWLLHDDATVLPGTLSGLLDVATSADDIAIVGPKIREWPSLRRLLEVGLTVTRAGARETGLESGEPDAGQHDRPRDVLAVNSAGMLIRRDVWDELDGFDPDLPQFYDDIDLGWRAWRAGHRVRTAPAGVIFHVEAGQRNARKRARGDLPVWERRRAAIWTQLANAGRVAFWWQYLRLFVGSLVRCLGLVVTKNPEAAADELLALRSAYVHPIRLFRARRRRARTARVGPAAVRPLLAPVWLPYRHAYDAVRDVTVAIVRPEAVMTTGRRSTVLDQAPEEAEDLDDGPSWLRQRPWFATVCVLTVLALVAGRDVLGGLASGVQGGALPRSPESAFGWWDLLLGAERSIGLVDGVPPIFALPLAVFATPVWTRPDVVVTILMLLAVPLSGLAAHRLGRLITTHRALRIAWAVSYAAMVAAVGAAPQGRLGTVVALVVAPVAMNIAWQLAADPQWRTALRLGIAIAVGAAFAPVCLLLAMGGLALLWYLEGRWVSRQLVVAVLTPLVLLGPWLVARAGVPWRWWWEAGFALPGDETVLEIIAGRAGGVSAPWWLSIPVLVLAVVALIPERSRMAVRACWIFGLWCLAVALLGHVTEFAGPSGRIDLSPWVGVPAVLWLASLATGVLIASPELVGQARRVLTTAVVLAALVLPLGAGAWWLGVGGADPLTDARTPQVPTFLADRDGLTLLIESGDDDRLRYRLVSGRGGYLGQEALAPSADELKDVTGAVEHLIGRAGEADVRALSRAGVSAIYLPSGADSDEIARRIDAAPLLDQTGSDRPGARAWTFVDDPTVTTAAVPWWRRVVTGIQLVLWLVAIVLTVPVRRRDEQVEVDEAEANADQVIATAIVPQDTQKGAGR